MGTRNLTMVYSRGVPKIAQYCQWDGYPSGVGMSVLNQLKRLNIHSFREKVDLLKCKDRYSLFEDSVNSQNSLEDTITKLEHKEKSLKKTDPHFSRDCGPDIIRLVNEGIVETVLLSTDFAADSLFCEWAYVIDLDKSTLEIYKGFNRDPLTPDDRFFYLQKERDEIEYYPIKIIGLYNLNNLPDDETFLNTGQDYNIPFVKAE